MKKRLLVFLLSLSLCLSLGVSVNAASTQNSLDEYGFSDAYISFSEQLAEKGISAQTCLEDFISGYESFGGGIEQYIGALVEYETRQAPALNTTVSQNLEIASEYFATHSETTSTEYSTRSVGGQWYDNIGETNPKLPQAADYSSYNILTKVKKGDILHETSGGVATLVGHIAVVEGKYWDSTYKQYYIRTVEATLPTVTHGVLDDDRYDHRGINVYYATSASDSQKSSAVNFCLSQIGKPWSLEFPLLSEVSYSSNTANWYCSELAWAGYYNAGINLHGSSIPRHIYTPAALASSSSLTLRNVE